jgi:hypothetical protein
LFIEEKQLFQDVAEGQAHVFARIVAGAVEEYYFSLVNIETDIIFNLDVFKTKRRRDSDYLVFLGLKIENHNRMDVLSSIVAVSH